jgi:hypothetical protein
LVRVRIRAMISVRVLSSFFALLFHC